MTKFKNPTFHKLFHDIAYAYCISKFNIIFGQIEIMDPISIKYLLDMGVN